MTATTMDTTRTRKRVKRCDVDRTELEQTAGWVYCGTCGRTTDQMAQESR